MERAMTSRSWSVQDARNRFSEVVEAARQEPQTVTKRGKPVVVIVAAAQYERLRKLQQLDAPSFAEMLLSIPRGGVIFERRKTKPRIIEF
jgi:prevent-host-death family protein